MGLAVIVVYVLYGVRERRRLAVVEREIRPIELLKEYPPAPVAEGRFLAGGLLYLNRDNPLILARGPQGLAINLAHPDTYILVAYLIGLILLVLWQGVLDVGSVKLQLALCLSQAADGKLTGKLDSPVQRLTGPPIDTISREA